jgi:hypothetical protein
MKKITATSNFLNVSAASLLGAKDSSHFDVADA